MTYREIVTNRIVGIDRAQRAGDVECHRPAGTRVPRQTQAAANAELGRLQVRGIRTARVVQERAESRGQMLKLPALTADMKARLADTKAALAGKPLQACN